MSISRAAIAAYLDAEFSSLASAIGQVDADDSPSGYGPDIDNALRQLGKAESDLATATVADGDRAAAFALAEYYTARRMWRRLGDRANVKVDDSQFDYRSVLSNAKTIMDDAQRRCAALGYDVAGSAWSVGWLNLDYLEPEEA